MKDIRKEFASFVIRAGYYILNTGPDMTIRAARLEATEILDIGVHRGTPFLYRNFPDAKFFLIDPQEMGASILNHTPNNFEFLQIAVGKEPGESMLNEYEMEGRSTLIERTQLTASKIKKSYPVKVDTIDNIIDRHCTSEQIGIKIDIEGLEFEAILGLSRHVHRISFLISECSVKKRFKNGYNFSELVALLLQKDLIFYNILNPPLRRAPRFYDVLFLPRNDPRFS